MPTARVAAAHPFERRPVSGALGAEIHTAANYGSPDMKAEHPVVRRHPETGHPSLFVNRQFTRRIPPLSRDESDSLLELLFRHGTQPDVSCRYAWEKGTIGVSDNRCTQHCAVNDYEGEPVISRVTILGDKPEPAFEDKGWEPHQYPRHSALASGLDRN